MLKTIKNVLRGRTILEKVTLQLEDSRVSLLNSLAEQERAEAEVACFHKRIKRLETFIKLARAS